MRTDLTNITIVPHAPDQADAAARLLARAFVTNPLHVEAFGARQLVRNEAFFRMGLRLMKGPKMAAMDGSRLVGVIHWVSSPACQHSAGTKLRLVPSMMRNLGVRSASRVVVWLAAWARLDPAEPHLHLGPIGVDPAVQGRGIGHRMMESYCQALDHAGVRGYLETDRPENVNFYRWFDFEMATTHSVLGVPNYFMCREARRVTPRFVGREPS